MTTTGLFGVTVQMLFGVVSGLPGTAALVVAWTIFLGGLLVALNLNVVAARWSRERWAERPVPHSRLARVERLRDAAQLEARLLRLYHEGRALDQAPMTGRPRAFALGAWATTVLGALAAGREQGRIDQFPKPFDWHGNPAAHDEAHTAALALLRVWLSL